MGERTPYRRMAFPNQPPVDMDDLEFEGVNDRALGRWLRALRAFLEGVSTATGRP